MKFVGGKAGLGIAALASSLSLLCARPALAAPAPLVVGGGWQVFIWPDIGPISNPADGFVVNSPGPINIKITDAFVKGDSFDLYVDGVLRLSTPDVPVSFVGTTGDPDVAYGSPDYSWGSLLVAAGSHDIDIFVRAQPGEGGAFIRADRAPSTVPEPASMALLATGALPLLRRLRRRPENGTTTL